MKTLKIIEKINLILLIANLNNEVINSVFILENRPMNTTFFHVIGISISVILTNCLLCFYAEDLFINKADTRYQNQLQHLSYALALIYNLMLIHIFYSETLFYACLNN